MQIKKRLIITLVLTVLTLLLTNNFWLQFTPLTFEMNIDSKIKNEITVQTVLNKENNDEFKKVYSEQREINLAEKTNFKVSFKKVHHKKRLKLIMKKLTPNAEYKVSRLSFSNGKYQLNDLTEFSAKNAKIKVENDKLSVVPKNSEVTLVYSKELTGYPDATFDIHIFLIIGICSFLLFYKLTDYLADFKISKNASRLDIVFLAVCAILLVIPLSNINQESVSKSENRTLAKWKPLITKNNNINFNFGKDYDKWISDRFAGRDSAIKYFNKFKAKISIFYQTDRLLEGTDGWLFYLGNDSLSNYLRTSTLSDKQLLELKNYLTKINEYCKANNKQFIFYIAPDKNSIYGEYFDKRFTPLNLKTNKRLAQQVVDYLKENSDIEVVYPIKELIDYKSNKPGQYLYFKQDTHWTYTGARVGYETLINRLTQRGVPVNVVSDFTYKKSAGDFDLFDMYPSGLGKTKDTELYPKLQVEVVSKCTKLDVQQKKKDWQQNIECVNGVDNNLKLVAYRDSFAIKLVPYLNSTFGKTRYYYEYEIKSNTLEGADIVVLESVERLLPQNIKMWKFIE